MSFVTSIKSISRGPSSDVSNSAPLIAEVSLSRALDIYFMSCELETVMFPSFFAFSNGHINIAQVKMKLTNQCIININYISSFLFCDFSKWLVTAAFFCQDFKESEKTISVLDLILYSTLHCVLVIHFGTQQQFPLPLVVTSADRFST